ncbi:MAG TPA: hypothetical protein VK620_16040, partial [Bradyrhizobium sp.]|nr:hypothetical protein [Bradyrhizobium sp.]
FTQKRPRSFVSAPRSIAVAESAKARFCEIFDVVRFSTFATLSAISRHRAHGGAELRWNADTFAEMHRSIAVAACEE